MSGKHRYFIRRLVGILPMLAALLLGSGPAVAQAPAAPDCRFVLGFATLRELVGPATVGDCLEDQQTNADNGDASQRTTGGLLVWRSADNWTAFTDGYTTWLNGPNGLEQRLADERFAWEDDAPPTATAAPEPLSACSPPPAPSGRPLVQIGQTVQPLYVLKGDTQPLTTLKGDTQPLTTLKDGIQPLSALASDLQPLTGP